VYVGHLRRYRFVFRHLISGIPRRERRSVKKKKDLDDFCKANIRQLSWRKSAKGRMQVIQ
jgi:hypothetical protein